VEAATEHFGYFGYEKTTVSDLAKTIGFSKAYIYKFFDSKQAIGEVICANRLAKISEVVNDAIADAPTASEKLRRLLNALIEAGNDLFFHDRKLYDIAAVASRERWPSAAVYQQQLRQLIQHIIQEGRQAGSLNEKPRWMRPLMPSVWSCSLIFARYSCNLTSIPHPLRPYCYPH
jgi:AcrR family transcriptional regulator